MAVMRTGNDVEIHWPQADVDAIFAAMERGRRELNWPMGQSLRKAMHSVVRSLGTSTRVAPKYRKYELVRESAQKVRENGGRKLYRVTSDRRGGRDFFVRAESVRDLKDNPRVIIQLAGFAKASWYRAAHKFGAFGGMGAGVTGKAKAEAANAVTSEGRFSGDDPYAYVENRVPYMAEALEGGPRSVDGAMARAARGLEAQIDNYVKRHMGAS